MKRKWNHASLSFLGLINLQWIWLNVTWLWAETIKRVKESNYCWMQNINKCYYWMFFFTTKDTRTGPVYHHEYALSSIQQLGVELGVKIMIWIIVMIIITMLMGIMMKGKETKGKNDENGAIVKICLLLLIIIFHLFFCVLFIYKTFWLSVITVNYYRIRWW